VLTADQLSAILANCYRTRTSAPCSAPNGSYRDSATPDFTVLGSRLLFRASEFVHTSISRRNYDVHPDGRFLMVRRADGARPGAMVVVENWTEALRAASGRR
jgi:hypothetical protein